MTSVFDLAPVCWSARSTNSASRSSVVLMHIIMHYFYAGKLGDRAASSGSRPRPWRGPSDTGRGTAHTPEGRKPGLEPGPPLALMSLS